MAYEQLKLDNQLCFRLYTASRLITKSYLPLLDKYELTYSQYLVMMVLWQNDGLPVNTIAHILGLQTNTITPLLKRMEKQGYVARKEGEVDKRQVLIYLTEKGKRFEERAKDIPKELYNKLIHNGIDDEQLRTLINELDKIIPVLSQIAKDE